MAQRDNQRAKGKVGSKAVSVLEVTIYLVLWFLFYLVLGIFQQFLRIDSINSHIDATGGNSASLPVGSEGILQNVGTFARKVENDAYDAANSKVSLNFKASTWL